MDKDWLQKQTTLEEAERDDLAEHPRWQAFKAQMRPGDELWTFSSSEDSWRHLAGRAGYSIVRDGEIVDSFVTIMS